MNKNKQPLFRVFILLISLIFSVKLYAAPPTFSTAFSPATIGPGSISTLTYTIDNSAQTAGVSGVTFSNTLPTGVTVANPSNATTTCRNGSFIATAGSNSVAFTDYRLGSGNSCTLTLDVTSSTSGTHTNTTGALATSAGSVSAASASLTVDASRPGFSAAFSPASITPGATSTLTYTIDNSANGSDARLVKFTNTLPTGLTISSAPNTATTCQNPVQTLANPEENAISSTIFSVTMGETCTVSVDVTANTAGTYLNTTGELSQNGRNPSGVATAELAVANPFIYAAFPTSVSPGTSVQLAFTISNNIDRSNAATDITFTNDLNATLSGLTATALPADGFCGSGSTLTGSSTLTIAGANLISGSSCSFEVTVLIPANAAAGTYTNTSSTVNLTLGSATTKSSISNSLVIKKAPSLTALFIDDPVSASGDVTLRYTLTNTDTTNEASAMTFTEEINSVVSGMVVKSPDNDNFCGLGSTIAANTDYSGFTSVDVAGANLVAGGSCAFDVILTIPADASPGSYAHSTSLVSASVNGETVYGAAATDNLVITAAPKLSLAIVETSVIPGATVTAEFTLNYSENATAGATAVGFSLNLESALTGLTSSTATQNDICGTGSSVSGTSILTFSGGSLSPDTRCTFSVTLQVPAGATPGLITAVSSAITATTSGSSVKSAAASDSLTITGLTLAKSFIGSPALPSSALTLRYTISNAASASTATDIQLKDYLHKALPGLAATSLPSSPCGPSSVLSGTTSLTFSGGELAPGESCTFDIPILAPSGASSGLYNSATEAMYATINGNNTITPAASAILTIEQLTVHLSSTASSPTSDSPIPVKIDFSRDVTNFVAGDLVIGNGSTSNFSGSGKSYTADITPTADGSVTIDLPADMVDDAISGTVKNPAATQLSLQFSATPAIATPSLTISAPSQTKINTGPITYTVTYTDAEKVNLTSNHITLNKTGTNATITVTNGSTNTPTVTLSDISGDGSLGISIGASSARNDINSAPAVGPSTAFTVDNTKASISITDTVAAAVNTSYTATFTFSEDVTGFEQSDISVTNANLSSFSASNAKVYTATVTPNNNGEVTLNVAGDAAADSVNNGNTAATQYSVTYDTSKPTLSISASSVPINTPFTATLTFNKGVTGLAQADIIATNASLSNFVSTSALIYTVTVTPTADGTVTLNVAADIAQDSATNGNTAATQYSVLYETRKPTVTISASSVPVNAPFTATFTLSEAVTGFTLADIIVANGSASNFAGSANVYTATITPAADGIVNVDVAADVAKDSAGNNNSAATQYNVTYDATVPTLVISSDTANPTNTSFTATFTLSEAFTGFALADITVTNGHASNFTGSGSVYTATITPTVDGVVSVDVAADVAQDSAGNNNSAATQYSVSYDVTVATLVISSDASTPTNTSFTATFTFSEAVTGFASADIVVANGSASNFAGSDSIYTATITPSASGAMSVDVAADVAQDSAGNNNSAATQYSITSDVTQPTVTISGSGVPVNAPFIVTFTFSEAVTGFALADISVTNGHASNFAGSGSVYTATIIPTADGVVNIDVAADIAQDSAGNNNSAATQYSVTYDVTVPTLVITSNANTPTNTSFTATLIFSETVTGFALADISIANGHASNFAGSGSVYTATITPTTEGLVSVDVAADIAQDSAGNNNSSASQYSVTYDVTVPTLVISSNTSNFTNTSVTATFTFSETVTSFALADITVANGSASNFAGSGSVYTVTITPAAEGVVNVDVAANVAQDSVGNNNSAASQYSITYDITQPTITISGSSVPVNAPFTATFTLSEAISGFTLIDITVTNGHASNFAGSGSVYTATINPTADGVVNVDVAADVAQDSTGNNNSAATQYTVNYDHTVPTLVINSDANNPTNISFTATFTLSEAVTNFALADITVTNGHASNFAGSGSVYTATITPTADGVVNIDVAADVTQDSAGNNNSAATQYSVTYDVTVPTLVITSNASNATNTSFTATFTLSEAVTGFALADITVANGYASNFAGSGSVYTATITPTTDGVMSVDVAADVAQDSAGNNNSTATQYTVTYDVIVPTLVISSDAANPTNTSVTTTFTFSEAVNGFALADITVTNGHASNFTSSGSVYTATIIPAADGVVNIDVAADVAQDSAGNNNRAASQYSITSDITQPTITISGSAVPINAPFTATLTLSEVVTGFALADITVTNGHASNFVGSGSVYTVTITPIENGVVNIDVAADVTQDSAGNNNSAATQYNVTYDATVPTLVITSNASTPTKAGFTATFTFSEAVTGFALADITVVNGHASNFAGSANVYTATITPTTDGVVSVDVAADVTQDSAGNNNSAATQYSVTYDATVPTLVISSDTANPTNTSFTATFTFSETVSGFALTDITVANGSASNFAGNGRVYTATMTPAENGVVSVDVAADAAQDSAGNNNSAATQYTINYDATVPTLVISSDAATLTNTSFTATFTLSETVIGFALRDITVTNGSASNFAGSGSVYTVLITPAANGAVTVDVSADVAQDSAGNNNNAATQYSVTYDVTVPTLVISSDAANDTNTNFTATFTLSEAVTDFVLADITVTNGHASNFAGSGSVYTVTITPSANGVVSVDVAADVAQDSAGNNNSAATQYTINYDHTVPTLVISSDTANPTNTSFTATFTFSEAVNDFVLTDITVTNGHASNFAGSGSVYTATITPTADGIVSVDVAANVAQDSAGNNNSAASQYTINHDQTVPTLVINSNATNPTNASFTASFTFSEAVTGFTLTDINVANASASNFASNGNAYTATITPSTLGVVSVDVAASVAQDSASNNNSAATQYTVNYDPTVPTLVISSNASTITNTSFIATFTFSEAVTGFALADITVANGSASNLSASGNVYSATITPAADGVVSVDVPANVAINLAGNNNATALQYAINYDATMPTLVISSDAINPTNASFTAAFTFSEAVTDFFLADIILVNATASNFAGSGSVYTATITPIADGVASVDVAANVAQDSASNNNSAALQYTVDYDVTLPTVTLSSDATPQSITGFTLTITFSEEVSGFTIDDISLSSGNLSTLTQEGAVYTALVTPEVEIIDISIDVLAGVAQDASGNDNSVAAALEIHLDNTAPKLVSSSPSHQNTEVIINDLTILLNFNEAIELQTNFGVIELVDLSDNTIAESLDLASSSPQVTINNNTATLDFNNTLIPDRQYGLRVSDTVFADIYANAFSGLSESQLIFITVNNAPVTTSDEASVDEDGSVAIAVLDNDSDSEGFLTASSVTVVDKSTNGQTSVNTANGVITYTPAADFNGSDSFSYQVSDFQGATSAVTQVIVTINAQNDLPVLANDLQVTEEDMTVIINVLANDTDIDDSLNSNSLVLVTEPVNGEAQVIDGQISYTPVADFNGSDSFTYRVADSTGAFGEAATVTLNISGSNDAPVAIDDAITTNEDTGVTLNVLTNDSDIDSELDATSISIITSAQHGAINIDAVTGDILYTPNEHFNGSDHFGYVVKDSLDATSNEAAVKITVISVNDAPVANDDIVVLQEDILHLINVLGNDTDVEQGIDASTVTLVSQPEQGQVSLDSQSGKFSYTPAANFFGDDSFSYRVEDSEGGLSNIANVRLTVQSVNDLPIVNPDSFIIAEDGDSNLAILANDADIDGVLDTSTLAIITTVAHGKLVDNNDGTVNYTPVSNYVGNDSFSYSVADNEGGVSNEVEVTISITSVNDAPEFTSDAITQVDEDNLYSYSIVAVDIDTQDISISDNLTITGKLPQWLNLTDNSDGSALLTGTPDNSQVGDHVISLMVTDSGNITDIQVFTLVVNNINDAPIADNIALTLDEDTQVSITPTASDADLNNLTFSAQTQPLNGQLDTSGEQWIYTPNANFHGVDSFNYIAEDNISHSEVATVSIEVRPVNDVPFAQNDFAHLDENTSVSIKLLGNDRDVDGNIASIEIIEQPASGELILSPDNSILYTPVFGFDGNVSFSYQVIDDLGASSEIALVNITVTNTNTAPTISGKPQTSVLSGDEYNFMPSVEDLDGDTLRFTISNKPDWTSFDKATGALTGQPNNNNVANYTNIVISVTDTTTETASLTAFNIEVLSLDKTPVADAQQITVLEDSLATITLTGTDPNGDSLTYMLIKQPINGILSGRLPELTYTPNENYAGTDSLSFSVTDGEFTSQEQTISIVVTQVNDAPLAENDTISVIEGQSALIDPLANDSDIDGDELTLVNATAGRGSVTIEDNKLSYQAIANFVGETQVSYTITDNMGETAQASVNINLLVDQLLVDPPVVIAPQELILNATALYTRVNLGVANATDRFGNPLPVFLDGTPFYQPGINFAIWKAEDASGRTASVKQRVNIHPLISLGNNQTVTEGDLVTVEVLLNGESPVYPLTIPYTVSGSAGEELDYDLSDGFIVIEAGTRGEISFNILTDEDSNEGDEDIIITLDTSLNLGSKIIHRILIAEQNIAPALTLNAMQNNINTLTAAQNNGLVTVNLSIFDPNTDDNHNIDWNDSNRALVNQSSDELSFIFDPAYLTVGLYRVNVKVTDDLGLSDSGYISIKVIAALQTLTTTDSDGDGIPDNEEGYQDEDNDGIPDYQDAIAVNNVLPAKGNNQQQFLVEGDPGVNLQLGDKALLSDNAGIQIEATDLILDENAKNVGGIFDFIANGLPEPGQSYNIVFPQQRAIPRGAILRKHSEDELGGQHWRGFTEITDTDMIRSTKGERGFCPPPGNNSKWLPGLTEGDWCIQITLRDGGPNDDDGLENGVIIDPVAMAVPVSNNNFPEAVDDMLTVTKDNSQVVINVLDNDLDADSNTLSLTSVNADLGIAMIQGESLLYTPPTNYIGSDRLVYSISDGNGGSAAAIVTILVLDYNQLPQALDDNASGNDATGITIDVLANDTDPDGDTLFIESASTSQGSVQVVDNELYYQPELGHIGSVRIEYVVNDGQGGLGGAALRLDIIQSNRAPEAKNDSATTTDRDSIIINVLSNDTDSDNDDLTLIDAIAQYGVASIDNNQLVYQPKLGFDGTDMVSYRISDGQGGESSSSVNITVTAYKTVKVKNSSGGSMGVLLIMIFAFICTGRRRRIHR
ncbi:MAG: hypothetical protein ACJAXJ_001749 [Colwellia sp.]|jgi:hypothetical protein